MSEFKDPALVLKNCSTSMILNDAYLNFFYFIYHFKGI